MIDRVRFPNYYPSSRDINPDLKDPMNQGVDGTKLVTQPRFINYMIMEKFRSLICKAAYNSTHTASVIIGNIYLVKELITIEKFERLFTHLDKTLSFITDSRSMIDSYPNYKRASLLALPQSLEWDLISPTRFYYHPKF